ncbi:excisionase family DNA binding protein [Nitrobacter vulgaris]|uniref:excisionase family DNA-binding protein n=1 Tax=Nitrobacter vulgaris TaxID=29421 RepID=UPI00285DC320|nr:excisionase family DNA-binding protein [Nitrobacter vulgaris]MDR6303070.1 excisionase family DNA binding protein [Nitrobacter vulgaris]
MTSECPFDEMSFNPSGAARVLGISDSKMFQLLAAGEVASFRVGRARRIKGSALNKYREANAV